jgi:hypothetical protein
MAEHSLPSFEVISAISADGTTRYAVLEVEAAGSGQVMATVH